MKVKLHPFFILPLERGKCAGLSSKKTAHSNHWVGPAASLDMVMTDVRPLSRNETYLAITTLSLFASQMTI
jgi:hypothetical protein